MFLVVIFLCFIDCELQSKSSILHCISKFVKILYSNHIKFQINQATLGLNRKFLFKGIENKIVRAYYEYMVDVAVIFNADRSHAERELMESLEFEIKLAHVSNANGAH